ncbi:MAG: hypothetical protein HPZ91_00925 [Lentisphaeria bacterium]|nr:hypothetical protein [Lentisphaeria bacterium]
MSADRVDRYLEKLKEKRDDAAFVSPEEFKRSFFERARRETPARKPAWYHTRLFRAAAAAAVLVGFAGVLLLDRQTEAPLQDSNVTAGAIERLKLMFNGESGTIGERLREAASLFGGTSGVGFLGDEIFTYERQSQATPDRVLRLSVFDRNLKPAGEVTLIFNGEDVAAIRTRDVSGEIVTTEASDGAEVVDANLKIRLPSGRDLCLSELIVGSDAVSYSVRDGMVVRREIARM